jgi:hypothetical protein
VRWRRRPGTWTGHALEPPHAGRRRIARNGTTRNSKGGGVQNFSTPQPYVRRAKQSQLASVHLDRGRPLHYRQNHREQARRAPVRQESVLRAAQSPCRVVGRARSGPFPGCREPTATPSVCQLDAALPGRLKITCLETQKRKFRIEALASKRKAIFANSVRKLPACLSSRARAGGRGLRWPRI